MKLVAVVLAVLVAAKVSAWTGDSTVGRGAGAGVLILLWLGHSWRFPFTSCWWCSGSPKRRDKGGRNWAPCWMCSGTGRRRRFGSVLLGRGFGAQ